MLIIGSIGFRVLAAGPSGAAEPTAAPPEGNAGELLRIDETFQGKSGALRLGTDDVTTSFDYQLEVQGEGALSSNATIDKNLAVSKTVPTLSVDSEANRVCIGSCLGVSGTKLEVNGAGTLVEALSNLYGVSAHSSDSEAIFGSGSTGYGITGVASGAGAYGVWAANPDGVALRGYHMGTPATYSAVAGISQSGIGIYGSNSNPMGLWAGYFQGTVQTNEDVSGAKFVATKLGHSLVPYTVGQSAGEYTAYAGLQLRRFDGTYLWLTDSTKLYKVRATDGFKIFDVTVGNNPNDVRFDGSYIWVAVGGANKVLKLNPATGATVCTLNLAAGTTPKYIALDGQYYWVTLGGTGDLIKVNSSCVQQGSAIDLTNNADSLGKIIYNGSYLWAVAGGPFDRLVININPSDTTAVGYSNVIGVNGQDIFFDNIYYWVTNQDDGTLTKFFLNNGIPQIFNTYTVGNGPQYLAYDGANLWVTNVGGQSVSKISTVDPTQRQDYPLGVVPTGIIFDGTYVWVSSATKLMRIYSGSGQGATDLRETLTLQNNSPLIPQRGSATVTGSAKFGDAAADTASIAGELTASTNVWGDATSGDTIESGGYNSSWINTNGPENSAGTYAGALVASRTGRIYSANWSGKIFYTDDGGTTWIQVGNLGSVDDLLESSNGTLYAAATTAGVGHVYKSINSGATWVDTGSLSGAATVYSIDEGYDGTLYAGTGNNGDLFKSTNGGTTWVNTADLTGEIGVQDVLEASDHTLYAAVSNGGKVYRSTDGGVSWIPSQQFGGASIIDSVAESPDGIVYAAARSGTGSQLVYRTTDHGLTWAKTSADPNTTIINYLAVGRYGTLFVGGTGAVGKVFFSSNGGASWSEQTLTGSDRVLSIVMGPSGSIFAGTGQNGNVYRLDLAKLNAGTYSCPAGHYVKNIIRNYVSQITGIECRPL